ncbi:MAG TPA: allantoicase [Polyangiaceae bacterium]|nr:allantoicase [Polyangiaceae bacterium]
MSEPQATGATFTGLVDLASSLLGSQPVGCSDDYFAEAHRMLQPGRAQFIPGKYTDRGKWMDGWESRRKRGPGHDYCIIELGVPGRVQAFDIDTQHFVGNHPAFASVEGAQLPPGIPLAQLQNAPFYELLGQSPLLPGSQNLFVAATPNPQLPGAVVTHLRLNIFPDGGVARFRAYGQVATAFQSTSSPQQPALDEVESAQVPLGLVDLAALRNGGTALACSDAHFGGMNHLLLPGRAENMGSGWETRRRRGPGYDWILIRLAARGVPRVIEVDTHHFKGNFPDRCSIETIDAAGARPTDLIASRDFHLLLPETRLYADQRHFFRSELRAPAPATHLRLNIFPDGGVSRLRVWSEIIV